MRALRLEVVAQARMLSEDHGLPPAEIARRLQCSVEAIRRNLEPDYRARRNADSARRMGRGDRRYCPRDPSPSLLGAGPIGSAGIPERLRVSPEALARRDAMLAASALRDLTSAICGDPPPGFSALDRRS